MTQGINGRRGWANSTNLAKLLLLIGASGAVAVAVDRNYVQDDDPLRVPLDGQIVYMRVTHDDDTVSFGNQPGAFGEEHDKVSSSTTYEMERQGDGNYKVKRGWNSDGTPNNSKNGYTYVRGQNTADSWKAPEPAPATAPVTAPAPATAPVTAPAPGTGTPSGTTPSSQQN